MSKMLQERLRLLGAIMRESQGIAGYHLNGDIEPWDDLEPTPDEAADAIDALEAERDRLREAIERLPTPISWDRWIEAPDIPVELEGAQAWKYVEPISPTAPKNAVHWSRIPENFSREREHCGGVWFFPFDPPLPPVRKP